MTGRNKADKEKAEWQLAFDLQEKKLLEGIKDACDNLKSFMRTEL